MIKQYRKRFIIIAMCSTAVVLFLILGTINAFNYINANKNSEEILDIIVQNGGEFPTPFTPGANGYEGISGITFETPFEARYFSIEATTDGKIISFNLRKIAAVTTEDAAKYFSAVFKKHKTSGRIDNYKYKSVDINGNKLYVFLDCNRDLSSCDTFLIFSVIIGFIGLIGVFLLILLLSKKALSPIEENYKKQKAFITNASHDIKTPLTVINTEADLINMDYGKNEYTDEIKKQVVKLNALTEKLVLLSKTEEIGNYTFSDVDLSKLLEGVCQTYENVAKCKSLDFNYDLAPDLSISGNAELLRQAFSLLLDNAVKYCAANGNISLSLAKNGKQCYICIYNEVSDISVGKHPEFFERFYRGNEARSGEKEGNGIGLSVVYAIIETHKGKITAESKDGKSILITVSL